MKPFGALLPYEEAKRVVETNIKPIARVETVDIDDSVDRVLAEDVEIAENIDLLEKGEPVTVTLF